MSKHIFYVLLLIIPASTTLFSSQSSLEEYKEQLRLNSIAQEIIEDYNKKNSCLPTATLQQHHSEAIKIIRQLFQTSQDLTQAPIGTRIKIGQVEFSKMRNCWQDDIFTYLIHHRERSWN